MSTRTWTYRLEIRCQSGRYFTPTEWRTRSSRQLGPGMGKPTTANIARWVKGFEESVNHGANRHLGPDAVMSARVLDNRTGEVVAIWERPTKE